MCRYFFGILNHKYPEYTKDLIRNSKKLRFEGDDDEENTSRIEVDEDWETELKAFPQFARKYHESTSLI